MIASNTGRGIQAIRRGRFYDPTMFKAMKEYLELRFLLFFNPLDSLRHLGWEGDVLARISRAFLLHLALCAYAGCSRRLHRAVVDAVSSEPPSWSSLPAANPRCCCSAVD